MVTAKETRGTDPRKEKYMLNKLKLMLQIFADDTAGSVDTDTAEGAGEQEHSQVAAEERAEAMQVVYGEPEDSDTAEEGQDAAGQDAQKNETPENKKPSFDELIKSPEYRAEYQKHMQNLITQRFRRYKGLEDTNRKQAEALTLLASKYGLDVNDADFSDKITAAIKSDDATYEKKAIELGVPIQFAKLLSETEADRDELKKSFTEISRAQEAQQHSVKLRQQAEETKKLMPNFDLDREMENDEFAAYIAGGMHPTKAMLAVHAEEIIPQTVKKVSDTAKRQVADSIASGMNRPREIGAGQAAAATVVKNDPSKLTLEDFREMERRAARGEKIKFS